ncbi:TIGR03862 family flavoprotein [Yoonia sp. 2307UL14-13]|uniref:TIGR03862 family flavoprotein n=1 Tax=Yoonia sp. 2307UL14-13 TaxID=3126506 RepID=UPI0030B01293
MTGAVVIGAGPAGLMAADVMSAAGMAVTVADAMPSFGRKFLMAGKSGLNLTKNEPLAVALAAYPSAPPALRDAISDFGPMEVMGWAEGLGQELFTGSTGRVFPTVMKASPLLRAWLARLDAQGVIRRTRWRWQGWQEGAVSFATPDGVVQVKPGVTVLAMGGASWARLGSDGRWADHMRNAVSPFAPANMGFVVSWSDHMRRFFGHPIKSIALHAGDLTSRGECIISEKGLEGGGIYAVSRAVRDGAPLTVDLLPDWPMDRVVAALQRSRGKASLSNHLRRVLRLDPARLALLSEFGRPFPNDLGPLVKALPIRHAGPLPIDQAISTAGGVRFDALTDDFMLRDLPGVFCAGEMLDWEAPTGGYLLTGCLATGRVAALGAIRYATDR